MKLTRVFHGRNLMLIYFIMSILISLPMVSITVKPQPYETQLYFRESPPGSWVPGVPVDDWVYLTVDIESPSTWDNTAQGIIGFEFSVHVDPNVLLVASPIYKNQLGCWLDDFIDYRMYYGHEPLFLVEEINMTTGHIVSVGSNIGGWEALGVGAGGNSNSTSLYGSSYGVMVLRFRSKSLTAYTRIEIYNANYVIMNASAPDSYSKIPFDVVDDGHYNPPPQGLLSGKVIDNATKATIPGAMISYVSGPTPFNDTTTNVDGNYTIPGLELGNYSIVASAVGYGDQTKNITIIEGPNTLNFELTSIAMPPGWIEGFVIDNKTKTTIAGATVMAYGAYNVTDDTGYYKIDNLPPTTYTVTAGAVGFPPQSKTTTVISEAGTTLNFTLESVSPYIAVVPHGTMNSSLAPGMNFTISIYTNYTGDDVWGYEFSLKYNPLVLQGVEVTNGDLITEEDGETQWIPGTFDNEVGKLTLTGSGFFFIDKPAPLASGPGTLATVTFQVVGIGTSDITLGTEVKPSRLYGYAEGGWGDPFLIIDGKTEPDRIQHGFFTNIQSIHDVAVIKIEAPTTAVAGGDYVPIDVTVANEGIYLELVNLTVTIHNGTTEIRTESFFFNLASGLFRVNSFSWDTAGLTSGTYTINATVTTFNPDKDPDDNTKTKQIEIIAIHDVAVINIEAQDEAAVEEIVPINVTVTNKGSFYENVNVTVSYDDTLIDLTLIDMLSLGESEIVEFSWNTTGLMPGTYTINATATIASDANITNNSNIKDIKLKWGYDVAVRSIGVSPTSVKAGELVNITVYVENLGVYNATFEVGVTYDASIETTSVTLAAGASTTTSFTWNTTGVAPASYTITAEALLLTDEDLTNNLKTRTIVLSLPLGAIVGTVTDALTGDPIQGATINANSYSSSTDADGHYNITDIPPGTYNVTVSAAKYISQSKTATVTTNMTITLDFTLTPLNGTISGIVTDSSTGDPVSGAHVNANGISVSTGTDGSYSIELTPGTYNVTVSADGYEDSSKTNINVIAGETKTVNFELTPIKPSQPPNILLYAGVATIAIIIIAAIAVYILKIRKPT